VAGIAAAPGPATRRRDRALACLTAAFGSDAELAPLLAPVWHRALTDERLALTFAWMREQLRVSLQEILEAGVAEGTVRKEPNPESLAWIILAACEALVREAPGGGVVPTADLLVALARLTEA
jgi:hypothetical protein